MALGITTIGITIKNVILCVNETQQLVKGVIVMLSVIKLSAAVARRVEKANEIYKICNISAIVMNVIILSVVFLTWFSK
jgi:hypothetical protein